jgi:hypothetical protein
MKIMSEEAATTSENSQSSNLVAQQFSEIRIFSIHDILKKLKVILNRNGIKKVFLFLDDFSELNEESQKVVVDSLIAPIIASYNDTFKIKIAAYPGRVYMGITDATKIVPVPLDFYDAFELSSANYVGVENAAIDYIKRTLEKRLYEFTKGHINISDIFKITDEVTLKDYLKLLFECTAAIPRSLGFILNYCYLSSINNGKQITSDNIKNAAMKHYTENIYPDFINDVRFKQSFYDDKTILDQVAQKHLMDEIVKYLFEIKRSTIRDYQTGKLNKQLFIETLEKCRAGSNFIFPTSHFYIDKESERLLKTLELSYIVNKFSEGSSRTPEEKISYYGLNYGLCLSKKIDYGRPKLRRSYDYWRQEEFDLTKFVFKTISNIETIECEYCNKVYDEKMYEIYNEDRRCFKCGELNTVTKKNRFEKKLEIKIEEWKAKSLPNTHISILRTLYNNKDKQLSASQIGALTDKHHLTVTNVMKTLIKSKYVKYIEKEKRYYSITNRSITEFFSDSIDNLIS